MGDRRPPAAGARLIRAALLLAAAFTAAAVGPVPDRRMLDAVEAQEFWAVGRLNLGGDRRFCTATLVAPRVVVTAAHCLYEPETGRPLPLANLRFVAGFRLGAYQALRAISAAREMTGFALAETPAPGDLVADVAFLTLDRPVAGVAPVRIGPVRGATGAIVSYSRDRSEAPSIASPCHALAASPPVAAFDCGADFGESGAPVFQGEGAARRLVAVVSALGALDAGGEVTLAVEVAPAAAALGIAEALE